MSLFAPQKMSLNESKNWASKSRRLKDSCLANTLDHHLYLINKAPSTTCTVSVRWRTCIRYTWRLQDC